MTAKTDPPGAEPAALLYHRAVENPLGPIQYDPEPTKPLAQSVFMLVASATCPACLADGTCLKEKGKANEDIVVCSQCGVIFTSSVIVDAALTAEEFAYWNEYDLAQDPSQAAFWSD